MLVIYFLHFALAWSMASIFLSNQCPLVHSNFNETSIYISAINIWRGVKNENLLLVISFFLETSSALPGAIKLDLSRWYWKITVDRCEHVRDIIREEAWLGWCITLFLHAVHPAGLSFNTMRHLDLPLRAESLAVAGVSSVHLAL